ncbi:MAG: hypothetical protein ACSLE8_12745 [Rhodococcus sp. (in: high G+C Gram-positive bacteria)]
MIESTKNTFLAKTIEHWLTRTSELGYTVAFCEVLIDRGYSVTHVSRQNAFEQGKDVIAIAPDGRVHAYQLKGGNITDRKWTTEVLPEIEKLRLYPVVHPSIPANAKHESWLVTNGDLEDTVRTGIALLNSNRWGEAPLQTIVKGELLRWFLDASEQFVPQNVGDYKLFLDLYFDDGRGRLDEQHLSLLLEEILRTNEPGLTGAERRRNISAAVLYTSYILQPFYATKNHVGCLHALTLLYVAILGVAERYALASEHYSPTLDLLEQEIDRITRDLETELLSGGLERLENPLWDGDLGVLRRQMAVDYLAAGKLHQMLRGEPSWRSVPAHQLLAWIENATMFWGEGATPGYVARFWLVKSLDPTRTRDFTDFLSMPLALIARENGRHGETGFASPYYRQEAVMRVMLELNDRGFAESFIGHAHTAWPLTLLLARYEQREVLESLWRDLTYISNVSFAPAHPADTFRWRNASGSEDARYPLQRQSFRELHEQANNCDDSAIPMALQTRPQIMPLFFLVFPQRFNADVVKFCDGVISLKSETQGP